MTKVYTGSVLGIRTLTEEQRAEVREELAWLETDLVRRRKKLAFWTECKARAEADPAMPQAKRDGALYFFKEAQKLIASGETLRAYLVAELQEQPEHQPAYHYAH
ncbi:hypothetical protein HB780_14665 [Rhizobium lusitanum]|uniref:hypothetical protein n=1 Tax=Rhizobium lusitanum TaxID=293958 RepID=UPI00161DB407|nr:hypothetical protein [Rhizobium lusitanum]QND46977.1 hypothetical protein HB780_14665 [Rhizobium lusitanum]